MNLFGLSFLSLIMTMRVPYKISYKKNSYWGHIWIKDISSAQKIIRQAHNKQPSSSMMEHISAELYEPIIDTFPDKL